MKIVINDIPKSLNKYVGRKNEWEYRADKQMWRDLVSWTALPQRPSKPFKHAFSHIELRLKGNYDKNKPRTEITIEEI